MVMSNNFDTRVDFVHFPQELFMGFPLALSQGLISALAASMSSKKTVRYALPYMPAASALALYWVKCPSVVSKYIDIGKDILQFFDKLLCGFLSRIDICIINNLPPYSSVNTMFTAAKFS